MKHCLLVLANLANDVCKSQKRTLNHRKSAHRNATKTHIETPQKCTLKCHKNAHYVV